MAVGWQTSNGNMHLTFWFKNGFLQFREPTFPAWQSFSISQRVLTHQVFTAIVEKNTSTTRIEN
jgi:hypothetical protein